MSYKDRSRKEMRLESVIKKVVEDRDKEAIQWLDNLRVIICLIYRVQEV
jgi:hypothetical protein